MMVAWNTVKAGDYLYQIKSELMGNTTMRRKAVFGVQIVSIDYEAGKAVVRWNGNAEKVWRRRDIEKLRRFKPDEAKLT